MATALVENEGTAAERDDLLRGLAVPARMFDNPGDLIKPDTKITVDLDPESDTFGRIYGLVAPADTCLLSDANADNPKTCWTVDDLRRDDPDLAYAHQGDAIVADDDGTLSTIKVAVLSGDLEHSTGYMSAEEARTYIENTGTQIAAVRYHWHPRGLVLSGVLFPSAFETETLRKVLASAVSLEARTFTFSSYIAKEDRYRLTGAILVNMPGFPIRRASAADIGTTDLIIAGSGAVYASDDIQPEPEAADIADDPSPETEEGGSPDSGGEPDLAEVVGELRNELDEIRAELRAHAEAIAAMLAV